MDQSKKDLLKERLRKDQGAVTPAATAVAEPGSYVSRETFIPEPELTESEIEQTFGGVPTRELVEPEEWHPGPEWRGQPTEVDEMPEGVTYSDTSLIPMKEAEDLPIVYGMEIAGELPESERDALAESVFSYVGVTPRDVSKYVGRWIRCLGCVVAPLSADITRRDATTGRLVTSHITWDAPLFKIDQIDPDTELHVIIGGGGMHGKRFARTMSALFKPGDWATSKEILISQEERKGIDPETGEVRPRRMYRFAYRNPKGQARAAR